MEQKFYYAKIFLFLECALLAFLGIFYFSCGDTLYVREADGNIAEFGATNDTGELTEGMAAVQVYTSQMDRIDTVGVMVSNYGQPLTSELHVRCEDITDGHLIAEQSFPAGELGINQYVYLDIPGGMEETRGNQVRITCTSSGTPGNAPTVLYNVENMLGHETAADNAGLSLSGSPLPGTMCIAVSGRNYVWTGPNYWKLVLLAAALLAAAYGVEAARAKKGKQTFFFGAVYILDKYSFLIRQLVQRSGASWSRC